MKRSTLPRSGVVTSFVCPADLHNRVRTICAASEQSMRQFLVRAAEREIARLADTAAV